ncbi:hypothetical protein CsSME_00016271 [Camellia sinensis var. sinensis]
MAARRHCSSSLWFSPLSSLLSLPPQRRPPSSHLYSFSPPPPPHSLHRFRRRLTLRGFRRRQRNRRR